MTDRELTFGALFDGIHGFGLGLAQAGPFRCSWTVENAAYPRSILSLRVPHAEHLADVREVRDPPRVRVLTGGFPCQDLSYAGLGAGIEGSRSGLWTEYARIIGEVQPELVLIENVPALLRRGMELVVENLVELGYGVEWDCLPAAAFGAPHLRDRVWIAAHRLGAPVIFGQPMALFPVTPAGAVELEHDDEPLEGDDERPTQWARWPRAGWVDGDPRLVMPLEPLARVAVVKRGRAFLPSPVAQPGGGLIGAVDRDGNPPEHPRQRFYHPETGRIVQKDLVHAVGFYGDELPPGMIAPPLLPTPMATHNRKSARALRSSTDNGRRSGGGQSSPPGLEQAAELLDGTIPRELTGVDPADLPAATRALYATPNARDGLGGSSDAEKRRADGRQVNLRDDVREREGLADPAVLAASGRVAALNPDWVEWLMGFPLGWTDLDVGPGDLVAAAWQDGEPDGIPRITARTPHRKERLTALGNALVPAAPEWIAARWLAARPR